MSSLSDIKHMLFGAPRDPLDRKTRGHLSLIAFYAWVGLGADGLSSSCYGPEEAFLALGGHSQLAIFLAIATALTVFIISIAYIQVIELFPGGGGGYKVATTLIGPKAGLVSGSALVVDYVLTIAISVASAVDAMFSLMPPSMQGHKVGVESGLIVLLTWMNLRGMKESIQWLMPIFLGFVVTHLGLIVVGIAYHIEGLPSLLPNAVMETHNFTKEMGWVVVAALFLKAFSLGGGTYTGLEAVSNNVHTLAEPRIRTGKTTMFFVALSLAIMAAGIIMLYLLWDVKHVEGQTLNASVFGSIMQGWTWQGSPVAPYLLPIVLFLEAGLLFVASNTGFLAGPAVLANMATDKWMPNFFSSLSSRLVVKNGIVIMSVMALGALWVTNGLVSVLVVLYSINVFLTFSLSLLGLCIHWVKSRKKEKAWLRKLIIAFVGLTVTTTILLITVVEKFGAGGWLTLLCTSVVILIGWSIHRHYARVARAIEQATQDFAVLESKPTDVAPPLDRGKPTAAIVVGEHFGSGMHTLLWVRRLFPHTFHNFVFISVGEVDSGNFGEDEAWQQMRSRRKNLLRQFEAYCHRRDIPATSYINYGTDVTAKLAEQCDQVLKDFPQTVFFGTKLIFERETIFTQMLHNQASYLLQRRMHAKGRNMVILPMKIAA